MAPKKSKTVELPVVAPDGKVDGIRATMLTYYMPLVSETAPQTVSGNGDRQDKYLTITRVFVLCFGHKDPLNNDEPLEKYWQMPFDEIPAAKDMPALTDPDDEVVREAVIKGLVQRVRNWYKYMRNKNKKAEGGGQATLLQKHIDRVVDAFARAPYQPKSLDVYQRSFKNRYVNDFDRMWEQKEAAAEGDDDELARLARSRGGQERAFAALRWEQESEGTKEKVKKQRAKDHSKALQDHAKLWGAPTTALSNSRAWVMPEAGTFLQALLNWSAARFGVAMALTIAGTGDKGEPESRTIFATGEVHPGAPALDTFVSPTMKDVKIKMMQYARNMVTGRVPTGEAVPVVPAYAEDKEADDDAFDYELAAAVRLKEELAADPMMLFDTNDEQGWCADLMPGGDAVPVEQSAGPSQHSAARTSLRNANNLDMDADEDFDIDLPSDQDDPRVILGWDYGEDGSGLRLDDHRKWKGKGKAVDEWSQANARESRPERSSLLEDGFGFGMGVDGPQCDVEAGALGGGDGNGIRLGGRERDGAGEQSADVRAQANTTSTGDLENGVASTAERAALLDDPFTNDIGDDFLTVAGPHYDRRTATPDTRGSSPETSTSVYSARLNGRDKSRTPSVYDGDRRHFDLDMFGFNEDESDDADIDALVNANWTDRRHQSTKDKTGRTVLLGAISRSRGGRSRKREGGTIRPDDKETTDGTAKDDSAKDGTASERSAEKSTRATRSKGKSGSSTAGGAKKGAVPARSAEATMVMATAKRLVTAKGASELAKASGPANRSAEVEQPVTTDAEVFSPTPKKSRRVHKLRMDSPDSEDVATGGGSGDAYAGVEDAGDGGGNDSEFDALVRDVDTQRTEGWIRDHIDGLAKTEGGGAWKTYIGNIKAPSSRRRSLAEAIRAVSTDMRLTYVELVDAMEDLLRKDEAWDVGNGGHLDKGARPQEVTDMIARRGGALSGRVSSEWGDQVAAWWLSLQPPERGAGERVADLKEVSPNMDWRTITVAQGYKGAFLLVWCMMYWAKGGDKMALWKVVAEDMTSVFKAVHVGRRVADENATSGARGNSRKRQAGGKSMAQPARKVRKRS